MIPDANAAQESPRPWHRLFGLLLSDYLIDSPFSVELEMDLSHRKQLLDVYCSATSAWKTDASAA